MIELQLSHFTHNVSELPLRENIALIFGLTKLEIQFILYTGLFYIITIAKLKNNIIQNKNEPTVFSKINSGYTRLVILEIGLEKFKQNARRFLSLAVFEWLLINWIRTTNKFYFYTGKSI